MIVAASAAALLALASALYFTNLGSPYITLYDEGAHANVIKNLVEHCCVPHFHRIDLGTDYKAWLNNTVWLHKPLLPFYVTAAVYGLLGKTLWALRLPAVILAFLTSGLIFITGRKYLSSWAGGIGACLFCLNPFTHKLARGLTFAGFPDLFFVFFMSAALYTVLDWSQTRSGKSLRWFGLAIGLAYMCKGGLSLAPFAVIAVVALADKRIRDLLPVAQSVVIAVILVLPGMLYWSAHYPVEFRYEQQEQLLHLTESIDGFAGPWYAYVTYWLPVVLNGLLIPFAYYSVLYGAALSRRDGPAFVLSVWTLAYVVPLSFGVSKIGNFMFPALPAICLLVAHISIRVLQQRRYATLVALAVSAWPMAAIWFITYGKMTLSWIPIAAGALIFLVSEFLLNRMRLASAPLARGALVITGLGIAATYVYRDAWDDIRQPDDAPMQAQLREAAAGIRNLVDKDSLVLTNSSAEDNAPHVYLMYWSGVEALNVCRETQPATAIARFRGWKKLYLISREELPAKPIARFSLGALYPLNSIPFEVWSPVATRPCAKR
jgi:4-amino-4-deoxy-L-arabinose transferase-like glycosyltransferase